jgi:hypothetical protein
LNRILVNPITGEFVILAAGKLGKKIEDMFRRENPEGRLVEVDFEKIRSPKLRNQTNRIMAELFSSRRDST